MNKNGDLWSKMKGKEIQKGDNHTEGEKWEKQKTFLTAFIMAFILLSLAMIGTVLAVQPVLPAAQEEKEQYDYQPPASDTLTMIVAGMAGNIPQDFLLIRYNPQYGQIPLALLPPDTLAEGKTLGEIYTKEGAEALKRSVSSLFGIVVDRYAVLSGTIFMKLAAQIGSVVYELPYEIVYSREGSPVHFSYGKQQLDGQDLLDLFQVTTLKQNHVEKSELLGDIIAEAINQNMSAASEKRAASVFKLAVNAVRTDVTSTDFELRRESAAFLAGMDARFAGNLPVQGEWQDGSFVLSEAFLSRVRQYFQPA